MFLGRTSCRRRYRPATLTGVKHEPLLDPRLQRAFAPSGYEAPADLFLHRRRVPLRTRNSRHFDCDVSDDCSLRAGGSHRPERDLQTRFERVRRGPRSMVALLSAANAVVLALGNILCGVLQPPGQRRVPAAHTATHAVVVLDLGFLMRMSAIFCAIVRAIMSLGPPAGNGTISLIGLSGNSWAPAKPGAAKVHRPINSSFVIFMAILPMT